MKKILVTVVLAMAAAVSAFAAEDDTRIICYTQGKDLYKDGTVALDGEFYALVWTKAGAAFAGFKADATLADPAAGEVIAMMPNAEKGRLHASGVQIPAAKMAGYAGGRFALYLLDTRNADGKTLAAQATRDGKAWPAAVNGFGLVYEAGADAAVLSATLNVSSPIKADVTSAVPADAPKPVVTAMSFREGANGRELVLRVKGTAAYLRYTATAVNLGGTRSGASEDGATTVASTSANGAADPDDEVEFVYPATADSCLLQVIRK